MLHVNWTRAMGLALVAGFVACGTAVEDGGDGGGDTGIGDDTGSVWAAPSVDPAAPPAKLLSEYNLVRVTADGALEYNEGVVPYEMNSPLFSDFALKDRAIYVPAGQKATYDDNEVLELPLGSAILKTFSFPADFRSPDENVDHIETRVLIHATGGWKAYPYLWDAELGDAKLAVGGAVVDVSFVDEAGENVDVPYLVPQKNQCVDCHELKDGDDRFFTPIGPKARHLNRMHTYDGVEKNQLQHLADLGMLEGLPSLDQVDKAYDFRHIEENGIDGLTDAEIDEAARDYLDINCAHCHNPRGTEGISSQLFLNYDNDSAFNYGVCKKPGSAGHGTGGFTYDIVPGVPEESILLFRMETTDLGAMMPDIGRALVHPEAVELVSAWIANLEGNCSE